MKFTFINLIKRFFLKLRRLALNQEKSTQKFIKRFSGN